MSQFQQHPSPVDELKNKKDTIDFSKVFNTSKTPKRNTYRPTNNAAKTVKRIILAIIISSLILTLVPVGIGVYLGIKEVIDDNYIENYEEDYVYEWYDTYTDLEDNFPELAKIAQPYREYVEEKTDLYASSYGSYDLYESYCVDEYELDYVYISGGLDFPTTYLSIVVTRYEEDDPWYEYYYGYSYFDENEQPYVETQIIEAISQVTNISYDTLLQNANSFVSDLVIGEDAYVEYPVGNGTFSIDYYDQCIDYGYSKILNIN